MICLARLARLARLVLRAFRPPHVSIPRVPLPIWAILALIIAGCSEDPATPEPGSEPPALPIVGLEYEPVLFEGDASEVSVFGIYPGGTGEAKGLEVRLLSWPGAGSGCIQLRVPTRRGGPSVSAGERFDLSGRLPTLPPGEYEIRAGGLPSGYTERLQVFSRGAWVRYRSHIRPGSAREGLCVHQDGRAIAYRRGAGQAARMHLTETTIERVDALIDETGFWDLDDTYILDGVRPYHRIDVAVRQDGAAKRVRADLDRAPDRLRRLVQRLSGVIDLILEQNPERPPIVGRIQVEPSEGPPGTSRVLTLTLLNRSGRDATLHFPTSQQFDLLLVLSPGPPPPDLPGDPPEILVWNWAHDRDFLPAMSTLHFGPREGKVFEVTWNGLSNWGSQVETGEYTVRGVIPATVPAPVTPAGLRVGPHETGPGLVGSVSIEPRLAPPGTARTLELTVTNTAQDPITIEYGSTQRFDFSIEDPRSASPVPLWFWSHDLMFATVMGWETWQAGESHSHSAIWDGFAMDGQIVPEGLYTVSGWTTGQPFARSPAVSFEVVRE